MALGEEAEAREVLLELAQFASREDEDRPKIDYFATSLPNLLLFDDDLEKRNRIESTAVERLGERWVWAKRRRHWSCCKK